MCSDFGLTYGLMAYGLFDTKPLHEPMLTQVPRMPYDITRLQLVNPLHAGPVYIQDLILVITLLAAIIAPNSAVPSAGTVLSERLDLFKFLQFLMILCRVPTALEKSLKFISVSRSWKNHWISWKALEICRNEKIREKSLNFGSVTHEKIIEFWNRHSFD